MKRSELVQYAKEYFTYNHETGSLFDKINQKLIPSYPRTQYLRIKGIKLNRAIISWILFYEEVPYFDVCFYNDKFEYNINNLCEGDKDPSNKLYHKLRNRSKAQLTTPNKRTRKHIKNPTDIEVIKEALRVYRYDPTNGDLFRFNKLLSPKTNKLSVCDVRLGRAALSWILHNRKLPPYRIWLKDTQKGYQIDNLIFVKYKFKHHKIILSDII